MTQKNLNTRQTIQLEQRINDYISAQNNLEPDCKIVVAVSGGADSFALLHILHNIDFPLQLIAVYINHELRPLEVPGEIEKISNCCHLLQIPFITETVHVKQFALKEKRSIEEAARILRYAALEQIRLKHSANFIAVGHTADDQVEGFFIRIIRGGSRKSLSGMTRDSRTIIRPLLLENKKTLTNYLTEKNFSWCIDSSNLEKSFLRNRIRLDLLPLLEQQFNPSIRKTVIHSMDILSKEENYLADQTKLAIEKCLSFSRQNKSTRTDQITIDQRQFFKYHQAIQNRILENACWTLTIRPSYQHIQALSQLIENPHGGKELHLSDGVRAEKSENKIVLSRPLHSGELRGSRKSPSIEEHLIDGVGQYSIEETGNTLILTSFPSTHKKKRPHTNLFVDSDKVTFPIILRSYLPGERFKPFGRSGTKRISRFLNDKKIDAKRRSSIPVLLTAGNIIALPGIEIDDNFKITDATQTILAIEWQSPSENE